MGNSEDQSDTSRSLLTLPQQMYIYLDALLDAHTINKLGKAFEFRFQNIPGLTKQLSSSLPEIDMFIVWALLEHMEFEGHLKIEKQISEVGEIKKYESKLTMGGYLFRMHGGYKRQEVIRRAEQDEKEELKQQSTRATQAAINADNSTKKMNEDILPLNLAAQQKASRWSLALAALSVFFIAITIWLQYQDKTDKQIENLNGTLINQSKTLEKIKASLDSINTSTKQKNHDAIYRVSPVKK